MDVFASGQLFNGCFVVQNISPQIKTINIFQYPINYLQTRNLLAIPGVSEGDIRVSLLRGELNYKIRARDITVICSDIDLTQFNANQLAFLQAAGIVYGLQGGLYPHYLDVTLVGSVDGVNTDFTIPSGHFVVGLNAYKILVYRNGVRQSVNDDFFIAESIPGQGFDTIVFVLAPLVGDEITADYYLVM